MTSKLGERLNFHILSSVRTHVDTENPVAFNLRETSLAVGFPCFLPPSRMCSGTLTMLLSKWVIVLHNCLSLTINTKVKSNNDFQY